MRSPKALRRSPHARDAEGTADVVDVGPLEREHRRTDHKGIPVAFTHGLALRMEALRRLVDPADRDIRRQQAVDRALQFLTRDRRTGFEMRHLRVRVHPGIRPPAPDDTHLLLENAPERFLEGPLDCRLLCAVCCVLSAWCWALVALNLPSRIPRPVVRDGELEGSHETCLSPVTCHLSRLMSNSAIWTALVAAPLRRLSPLTHSARPCATVSSRRMRPTSTSSRPAASNGRGCCRRAGSSMSRTPGAFASRLRAWSGERGCCISIQIASE